jgi:putative transposase
MVVDTQGNLLDVKVTAASDSDLAGAKKVLSPLKDLFPKLSQLWGDSHYGGTLILWLFEQLGWNMEVVRGLGTTPKPEGTGVQAPEPSSKTGFRVLPRRWVVERSIAWMVRWRRLCRDHEGLPASSEAFIKLSASRRMLSHLAPPFP